MGRLKDTFGKYLELTKPKVTLLNLLVGVTCFFLAAYPTADWMKLAAFSVVGYLAAGGCGVLNSVYDQDVDKLMMRTSKRAIPAGYITTNKALIFGIAMVAVSFVFSYFLFNPLTVLMLALGLVFYLAVYTVWFKRASPWNVVIGGFAGCFAALSGWTAAVNTLSLVPLLVAGLDFLWTPGHLWGLAIKKMKEYKLAGIPMLPVKFGKNKAAKTIFWLNTATVAFSFLFPLLNLTGTIYSAIAVAAGIGFLAVSLCLAAFPSETGGFRVFLMSMPYLTCLMVGLMADKLIFI
jgi:protoheme IX farnesyltransferase